MKREEIAASHEENKEAPQKTGIFLLKRGGLSSEIDKCGEQENSNFIQL